MNGLHPSIHNPYVHTHNFTIITFTTLTFTTLAPQKPYSKGPERTHRL